MEPFQEFEQILHTIPLEAAINYSKNISLLVNYVNQEIAKRNDLPYLIGKNPFSVMVNNHENHAQFMSSIFELKNVKTFLYIVSWAYKSYIARGFSPHYFSIELALWKEAVEKYLNPEKAKPISELYALMLKHHDFFLTLSLSEDKVNIKSEMSSYYEKFLKGLLKPDVKECIDIANEYIKNPSDIATWYEEIILPSMYEIGEKWSKGEINVCQEHIATLIVQRVMSVFYPMILSLPKNKGKILVGASMGELHEVGTRMVSDFLEMAGWNVYYCGANTPNESLFYMIEKNKIQFLCISTTITYHLKNVKELVVQLKKSYPTLHVIVGGQAYSNDSQMWKFVEANAFFKTGRQLVEYLQNF